VNKIRYGSSMKKSRVIAKNAFDSTKKIGGKP
jgi:hypothetical protein